VAAGEGEAVVDAAPMAGQPLPPASELTDEGRDRLGQILQDLEAAKQRLDGLLKG